MEHCHDVQQEREDDEEYERQHGEEDEVELQPAGRGISELSERRATDYAIAEPVLPPPSHAPTIHASASAPAQLDQREFSCMPVIREQDLAREELERDKQEHLQSFFDSMPAGQSETDTPLGAITEEDEYDLADDAAVQEQVEIVTSRVVKTKKTTFRFFSFFFRFFRFFYFCKNKKRGKKRRGQMHSRCTGSSSGSLWSMREAGFA